MRRTQSTAFMIAAAALVVLTALFCVFLIELRRENRSLRAKRAAAEEALARRPAADAQPVPSGAANAAAQGRLDAYFCANHLRQIGIAARQWAEQHGGHGPTNLLDLKDALAPMILVCPASKPESLALVWSGDKTDLAPAAVSYQLLAPGATWDGPPAPVVRCPLHHSEVCKPDAIVVMASEAAR